MVDQYVSMMRYAMDGRFFSYITGETVRSRAWHDLYAIDDADLSLSGTVFGKCVLHLRDVSRGVESSLISG